MNKDTRIPGHSVNKNYPFNGILSEATFPNRLGVTLDDKTREIMVDIDDRIWGKINWGKKRTQPESFLMMRVFDYHMALDQAEGQIRDILADQPFFPEDMGFELAIKNETVAEAPLKIYASKFDENISIFRKPGDPTDPEWNPNMWTLMTSKIIEGHRVFQEHDISLTCARIAFAVLSAFGVKMCDDSEVAEVVETTELKEHIDKRLKAVADKAGVRMVKINFNHTYLGEVIYDRDFDMTLRKDENEKDAISRLKFLIETDYYEDMTGIRDTEFEQYTVIQPQQSKRQHTESATEPPSEGHS